MEIDTPRLAALIRQHAETARLMGVDFVPAYSKHGGGSRTLSALPEEAPVVAVEVKPEPRTEPAAEGVVLFAGESPAGGDAKVKRTREQAQKLLDECRRQYEKDAPHKQFVTAFTNIVFGEGDPCARVMFVGEAPGEEEDRTGRPFVGRAGQLLEKMIVAMGFKREDVYIANVLKTRPPNNATPTTEEAKLCAPYLFRQIEIVSPEALVTLGLPATRLLLDSVAPMAKLRARWAIFRDPSGREVPVMPTYHPAYLLRNYTPEERAKVWSDLQMVMERLGLGKAAKA